MMQTAGSRIDVSVAQLNLCEAPAVGGTQPRWFFEETSSCQQHAVTHQCRSWDTVTAGTANCLVAWMCLAVVWLLCRILFPTTPSKEQCCMSWMLSCHTDVFVNAVHFLLGTMLSFGAAQCSLIVASALWWSVTWHQAANPFGRAMHKKTEPIQTCTCPISMWLDMSAHADKQELQWVWKWGSNSRNNLTQQMTNSAAKQHCFQHLNPLEKQFSTKMWCTPIAFVQRNRRTVQSQAWHEELQQTWMIIAFLTQFWHHFDIACHCCFCCSAPSWTGIFCLFSLHMDQGRKMSFCTAGMQPMVVENGDFHHGEKLSCKDAWIKTGFSWKCQSHQMCNQSIG